MSIMMHFKTQKIYINVIECYFNFFFFKVCKQHCLLWFVLEHFQSWGKSIFGIQFSRYSRVSGLYVFVIDPQQMGQEDKYIWVPNISRISTSNNTSYT